MVHRHFEVMKSISVGSPNVQPLTFGIDTILEDFASLIKE